MKPIEVTTFMDVPDNWTTIRLAEELTRYMELIEEETPITVTWQFIEPIEGEENGLEND